MTRLQAIRGLANTVAVASVLLLIIPYAVEAASITLRGAWDRPFFYHGDFLGRLMSCSTWLLLALLLSVCAPLINRLPGTQRTTSVHTFLFSTAGAVLTVAAPAFFLAQSAVYAVKITLYRSWATEGRIFTEFDGYPHNMLLILLPWFFTGLVLLLLGRESSRDEPVA